MDIVPQLIANSIIAAAIYALVAIGFNFIYGATKFFNLAHGVIAAIGGYGVYYFANELGWSLWVAIPLAITIAALVGWLLDLFIYKPLRARKASQMVLLVASLGAFTCLQAFLAIIFTSQFQTLSSNSGDVSTYDISAPFHALFGSMGFDFSGTAIVTQVQLIMIVSVIVIMLALGIFLKKSLFGKAVEAISDDEAVAKIVGINTEKVVGRVFIIGSAIAGLAGILVGFDTGLEPTMSMSLLLKGVIASIIGGIGGVYGAVLGALLLGFVENFGIWQISGEWKDAIAFGLLIIFLLFKPEGILRR